MYMIPDKLSNIYNWQYTVYTETFPLSTPGGLAFMMFFLLHNTTVKVSVLVLLNILLLQDLHASDHSFGNLLNMKAQCLMATHDKGYTVNGQVAGTSCHGHQAQGLS